MCLFPFDAKKIIIDVSCCKYGCDLRTSEVEYFIDVLQIGGVAYMHYEHYRILWIWFLRCPNLSTEVSTIRQIKSPGTGMMQLALQEKERRRCFDSGAKVVCFFVYSGSIYIYI